MVVLNMKLFIMFFAFLAATFSQPAADRKPDRTISIEAERFTFNPSKITVNPGDLIEFVLTSDDTGHGFRIPSAGIDVAIPPRGRGELRVRYQAPESGEITFECSRPCGAGHNLMRGTIVVKKGKKKS